MNRASGPRTGGPPGSRRLIAVPVLLALVMAASGCGEEPGKRADTVVTDETFIPVPPPLPSPTRSSASPSRSPSPATPTASPSTTPPKPTRTPTATRSGGGTGDRKGGSETSGGSGGGKGRGGGKGTGGSGRSGGTGPGPGPTGTGGQKPSAEPSTGPGPKPTPKATPTAPTTARLTRALLTTAHLPGGYVKTTLDHYPANRSSRPDCLQRLNALELERSTTPGAVESRVAFAQSQSGPFLQQILRWLPGDGARRELNNAVNTLSGCGTYTIGWPNGTEARQTVVPLGPAGVGSASWHATVTVDYGPVVVSETLVLVVVGRTLMILSHLAGPESPPRPQTLSLASTGASRIP
ncbi:hypothetical protein ACFYT4_34705 [Streptomyces sp. NPDC004609]|uniref:hypothetical protein n=1 Tax=Streptomyces sp. NPDC004609 TaxID=3364704 RepID=UPI0036C157FE